VEQSPAPDPPFKLAIPAPGSMATLTGAGLRVGKEIRNSPGQVRSVISHLDQLIASGDFNMFSSWQQMDLPINWPNLRLVRCSRSAPRNLR